MEATRTKRHSLPRHTPHTWPLGTRLRGPQSSSIAQGTSGFFSASAFSLRPSSSFLFSLDFHFAQNTVAFFLTILFFCVSLWARINLQRPQAVFLTVLAAHTAVLLLDASPSRRVGILSERIHPSLRARKTALKNCVEASTFFSYFFCHDSTFFCAVCHIQGYTAAAV